MSLPALPKISHYINTIDLVRQFHYTFNHPVAKELTKSTAFYRRLRVQLILNELAELAQAAGVPIELEVKPTAEPDNKKAGIMNGMRKREWVAPPEMCYSDRHVDIVETADALADLDYVVQGSNLTFGIPAGLVMYEVHASNMSKLDDEGKPIWDENGKIVKGPNFKEPDIKSVLDTFDPQTELF